MSQEKKDQENSDEDTLKWDNKIKDDGIFDLIKPILGSLILLMEEERKRTIDQLEKTKETLERMKNNR